jgi:uncharacterized small protein (DUF1192 family)
VEILKLSQIQKQFQHTVKIEDKKLSSGEIINRIAILGSELQRMRQRSRGSKWTIPFFMMEVLDELARLGATLDQDGFVVTEGSW